MTEPTLAPTYTRTVLFQNEEFEIVRVNWQQQSCSPLHNHRWSECLVHIEQGTFENKVRIGAKQEVQTFEAGETLNTPVGAHHELRCLSSAGQSLHVYSPKLQTDDWNLNFNPQVSSQLKELLKLGASTAFSDLRKNLGLIESESISTHSPYFMNQLFSGASSQMLLAAKIVARTKTTLATFEASPALSSVEAEVIESLGRMIGWDQGARDGVAVPGGSAANFMALHCARQKAHPEFKTKGLNGKSFKIFVSKESHYSLKKACMVLGFGTDALVEVACDDFGRMQPASLQRLMQSCKLEGHEPLMVCATAGTTVKGAFDPIEPISAICREFKTWLHVDAAWGGPALFAKTLRPLLKGAELADSFTFDAHKFFGASLTSSFFLTQHKSLLLEANDVSGGDYIFHETKQLDRGRMSWQCGRAAEALSFWSIWKSLGDEGLESAVTQMLNVRDESLQWLSSQPRLQVVSQPEFLNLCVRVLPPPQSVQDSRSWSRHVRESLKENNQAMVNFSSDEQGDFLRLILSHPELTSSHVQKIFEWALAVEA